MAELLKLGRYELRRVLGKGAMGVVYEGFDPNLSRRVAVKTILKNAAIDAETERAYTARFIQEAKAVARLNHPNIVQVYDFGVEGDVAYLVMEFIQGRELRSVITGDEKISPVECVRIMGELLDALDFAHEAGVIHRDVKPANVILDAQRRVKLADFGVARVQDNDRSAAGTMVGTPAYMSPEQIQAHKIDRRTDIFSSGVVLYQLLTGEQPFRGDGAWTVAKKIMQDDPPLPSSLVASVSPAFDDIVERALAKAPADRYANARDFATALRAAIGPAPVTSPYGPKPKVRAVAKGIDAEVAFWRSIQNSSNTEEFKVYLEQFPNGTYARLARAKLEDLQASRQKDATVAIAEPIPPETKKRSSAIPAGIALALIAAGLSAYVFLARTPPPAPVEQAPEPPKLEAVAPPPKAEVSATDIEKIRKETEEQIQREYADKSAAEQAAAKAAAAKAAAEKAVQEKQVAEKAAAEKAMSERIAAAERAAVAAERATAERVATAEKAARASAEKAAEEKAAAARAAENASVAAKTPIAAAPRDGVIPARYAFRVMTGQGGREVCLSVSVQEEIEIPTDRSQSVSGNDFSGLRFQNAKDGSIAATLRMWNRWGSGEAKLYGRVTADGYAGTYEYLAGGAGGCAGQWTLVRKGN